MKKNAKLMARDAIPYLKWFLRMQIAQYRKGACDYVLVLRALSDLKTARKLAFWGRK